MGQTRGSAIDEGAVSSLTSSLFRKLYCDGDVDELIGILDEPFTWFGVGEEECVVGREAVARMLRQFVGVIPACNVYDEEFRTVELAPGAYVCSGRAWVATDPATGVYLRVHQRLTAAFREVDGRLVCAHMHFSNPFSEMHPGERLFPAQMALQSSEYLQESIREQQRRLEEQQAELESIYNDAPCAIMVFLRAKDGTFKLLSANDATARMARVDPSTPWRTNWEKGYCGHVAAEDVDKVERAIAQLRKPGDRVEVTYRLECGSDEDVFVTAINTYVRDNDQGAVIQRIVVDVTDRVNLERALRRQNFEDPLTGVFNRSKFNQELYENPHEYSNRLGIAYFDINGLKRMNDEFGHAAGDDLIRRTTAHIDRHFTGQVYRIGGDEFVVIAPDMDERAFEAAVAAVCADMEAEDVSSAVGMSWRESGCSIAEQFEEADRLMYDDKAAYYRRRGIEHTSHYR